MIRVVIVLVVGLTLAACGESTEEAHERGYEDGIAEVCNEVEKISSRFHERLRSDRICY